MKVLMVEHFLPGSVYTLELCRALRTEEQITIFCSKGAPRPLEGVQWKDKLYAGGKGWAEALMRYGGGLLALAAEICTGRVHNQQELCRDCSGCKHSIPDGF